MSKLTAVLAWLLLSAASCVAGITYTAVSHGEQPASIIKVQGWVSGTNARVDFLESDTPEISTGSYLLSRSQGRDVYMVNPAVKTYTRWDVKQSMAGMAGTMQSMRALMNVKFEDPKVEELLDEDGGKIAGIPTRHHRYRTSYRMTMQMNGTHTSATVVQEDFWMAPALATNPALSLWLKKEPYKTGDDQLDQMIRSEMSKARGFPLKQITTTTVVDETGETHSSHAEIEVTEFKTVPIPPSRFLIPRGYQEMKMPALPDFKKLKKEQPSPLTL